MKLFIKVIGASLLELQEMRGRTFDYSNFKCNNWNEFFTTKTVKIFNRSTMSGERLLQLYRHSKEKKVNSW